MDTPEPDNPRPTARSSASTAPCSRNGPTPGPTPQRPSAPPASPTGSTPTITTAATPHSTASHQPTSYPTCVDRTTSRRYVRPDGLVTTFHTPTVPKSARRACRSVGLRRRGSHSAASTACLLVAYLRTVTTGERPRHKSRSPPGAVPATTCTSALPIMPRRWRRSRLLLVSDRCGPCPG